MKFTAIATMTVITAMTAQAGETKSAERSVIVCTEGNTSYVLLQARANASKMFAAIGVSIHWQLGLDRCPHQGILITIGGAGAPQGLPSDALAYALPYEGVHIHLLYDRIAHNKPTRLLPPLLAHVLVHEITHVLQGSEQHSAQGVMKARWSLDDFEDMQRKPLPFTSDDVSRIEQGLAMRAARPHVSEETVAAAER